jgi:hypothetical protein
MRLSSLLLAILVLILIKLLIAWSAVPSLPVKPIGGSISEPQSIDFLRKIRDSFLKR